MEDTGRRFDSSKLSEFCVRVLEKVGVSRENAQIVAGSLLAANLRGVDTHGITRLPIYGVGALGRSLRRTWSTPRSAHHLPPCIWTFLSSLGKNKYFSSLLVPR